MTLFFIGIAVLLVGFLIYGSIVEKVLAPTDAPTPAVALADGVDYVELPLWRIFMIQFLNIAGLGPIYGAISGALFGPAAFLWIAFGCIFAGAVHDYIVGMTSIRNKGMSVGELVGRYLGPVSLVVMRGFSLVLLMLLAVIFAKGPASILQNLISGFVDLPTWMNTTTFFYAILCYYFIAAFLPIDKIIAPLYPIFGAVLIFTAIALIVQVIAEGYSIPFEGFVNMHPEGTAIFPFLFLTIACGACSGFHATQTPMMARCVANEKQARVAFYGAMILEGIIAMIWAAVPMAFFSGQLAAQGLDSGAAATASAMLQAGSLNNPGAIVNTVSLGLLGVFGGFLAVLGVVVCPITSGDTCFRSMRLTIADSLHLPQSSFKNRLVVLLPLMVLGVLLNYVDFSVLWRYFAWSNQTLAAFALWMGTGYFAHTGQVSKHWMTTIPAAFMTAVCVAYILMAPIGFNLPEPLSRNIGIFVGFASLAAAHIMVDRKSKKKESRTPLSA